MSIEENCSLPWRMTSRIWIFLAFLVSCCSAVEVQLEGVLVAKVLIGIFGAISTGLVIAILVSMCLIILRLNHGPFGVPKIEPTKVPTKKPMKELKRQPAPVPCNEPGPSGSTALHLDGREARFVSVFSNPSTGTTFPDSNSNNRDSNQVTTAGTQPSESSNHFPPPPLTRRIPTAPAYPTTPEPKRDHPGVILTPQTLPTSFSPSYPAGPPPHYPSLGTHQQVRSYGIQPGIHLPRQPPYHLRQGPLGQPSYDLSQGPSRQVIPGTARPVGYFQHLNRLQAQSNRSYYGPSAEINLRQPASLGRPNIHSPVYPSLNHMY